MATHDPDAFESQPMQGDPLNTSGGYSAGDFVQWMPPSAEALQAQLSGYSVEAFLARGGMGAVYVGVQLSLDRPVAIKVLPALLHEMDPSFAERFQGEARAMARLNHPGIVGVYDFGQMADGTLYLVMEYVAGTDVAAMIASQGRLSSAEAMAITAHICDALGYAHREGVVHRDIKPANIMVSVKGEVKVADFGLAKISNADAVGLTRSGVVMGTLHFMAPEALVYGAKVDHRADIYAVGVMLYQMLTGRLPQGLFELPSKSVPGLDPRFDRVVADALRERVEERYQDIAQMRSALDSMMTQPLQMQQPAPPPAPRPRAKPSPVRQVPQKTSGGMGWVAAIALVLAAAGAWWMLKPKTPQTSTAASAPQAQPAASASPAKSQASLPTESLDGIAPGPWLELMPPWHASAKLVMEPDGSGFLVNDARRWSRFRRDSVEFKQVQNAPLRTTLQTGTLVTVDGGFELTAMLSHTGAAEHWTLMVPVGGRYLALEVNFQSGSLHAAPSLNSEARPVAALKQPGPHALRVRLTPVKEDQGRWVLMAYVGEQQALHWVGKEMDLPSPLESNLTRVAHSLPMAVGIGDAGSVLVKDIRLRALGGIVTLQPTPPPRALANVPAKPSAPVPATVPAQPMVKEQAGPPWVDAIAAMHSMPGLKREAAGVASFANDTQKMMRFSATQILVQSTQSARSRTPLIAPPITISGDFELDATVRTAGAASYSTLHVPVGNRHLPMGISFERGEIVVDPKLKATTAPNPGLRQPGEHRIQLQRKGQALTVSIDGVQALGWSGGDADLPATASVPQSMPMEFGFGAAGRMEITRLRLRGEVRLGAPTPVKATPAAPAVIAQAAPPPPKPAPPAPPLNAGEWQDFIKGWYTTPTMEREKDGSAYLPNLARTGRFRSDSFEINCLQGVGLTPYLVGVASISGGFECQATIRLSGDANEWHLRVPIGARYVLLVVNFTRGEATAEPELKSKVTRNRKSKRLGEHQVHFTVTPEVEGSDTFVLKVLLDGEETLHWAGKESDLGELPVKIGWADVPNPNILPMGFGFDGPGQFLCTRLQLRSLGGKVNVKIFDLPDP